MFYCIQVGRTLASVGCAVDAEMGHATGTIWPIAYFRSRNVDTFRVKTLIAAQPYLRVGQFSIVYGIILFPSFENELIIQKRLMFGKYRAMLGKYHAMLFLSACQSTICYYYYEMFLLTFLK